LELLAGARRALVIHGNYLGSRDWSLLSAHRRRMTVVYCPRTHAYFGHAAYPLEELLAAGVSVAVGTDSRASNPDLDLLGELRFVRRRFPRLAPRTILELGTLRGAEALGRDADFGSITVGKLARFALVPLGDEEPSDVEEFLLDDSTGARAWP
jgi:cytosine/adenosine deaminase-related metal-dependent hydrolase